jgi:thymidylate kinase
VTASISSAAAPRLDSSVNFGNTFTGRFLEELFAAYSRERLRYAVLRNYERWPDDFGKDVDLIVHPEDFGRHDAIVRALCQEWGLVPTLKASRGGHWAYYLVWVRAGGPLEGIYLDVRTDLSHMRFEYLPQRVVLEQQRDIGGVKVPSEAAEALALLLHCIFDKGYIRKDYLARVLFLLERAGAPFHALADKELGRGWGARLTAALATPERIVRLRPGLTAAILRRRPLAAARYAASRAKVAFDRIKNFVNPPGKLVILVGPDGSGKTTCSTAIVKRLSETRLKASNVYLGAQKPLLPTRVWSQKIRKKLRPEGHQKIVKDVNRKQRLRGIVHIMADKWLRYVVHVRPALVRGETVVLDRYFYDLRTFAHPLVKHPVIDRMIMSCIPEPALGFSLQADPAKIAARKNELTVAETARQIECYRGLKQWVRNFHEVDADGDLPTVIAWMSAEVVRLHGRSN